MWRAVMKVICVCEYCHTEGDKNFDDQPCACCQGTVFVEKICQCLEIPFELERFTGQTLIPARDCEVHEG